MTDLSLGGTDRKCYVCGCWIDNTDWYVHDSWHKNQTGHHEFDQNVRERIDQLFNDMVRIQSEIYLIEKVIGTQDSFRFVEKTPLPRSTHVEDDR